MKVLGMYFFLDRLPFDDKPSKSIITSFSCCTNNCREFPFLLPLLWETRKKNVQFFVKNKNLHNPIRDRILPILDSFREKRDLFNYGKNKMISFVHLLSIRKMNGRKCIHSVCMCICMHQHVKWFIEKLDPIQF